MKTRPLSLAALALCGLLTFAADADAFPGGGGPVIAPEPATALMTGLALLALGYATRRFR